MHTPSRVTWFWLCCTYYWYCIVHACLCSAELMKGTMLFPLYRGTSKLHGDTQWTCDKVACYYVLLLGSHKCATDILWNVCSRSEQKRVRPVARVMLVKVAGADLLWSKTCHTRGHSQRIHLWVAYLILLQPHKQVLQICKGRCDAPARLGGYESNALQLVVQEPTTKRTRVKTKKIDCWRDNLYTYIGIQMCPLWPCINAVHAICSVGWGCCQHGKHYDRRLPRTHHYMSNYYLFNNLRFDLLIIHSSYSWFSPCIAHTDCWSKSATAGWLESAIRRWFDLLRKEKKRLHLSALI